MNSVEDLRVSMFETSIAGLDLEGKSYSVISDVLKKRGLTLLYGCRTRVLTEPQRSLYEKMLIEVPREIALFMDPIVVSLALRDACDVSGVDYVWLDLEGDDDVACSCWMMEKDRAVVMGLTIGLLRRHLEKYLIDTYDHVTREDMVKVWEAGLGLEQCPICGKASPERRVIAASKRKFRGWTCKDCGHHVVVPSDILEYLKGNIEGSG